MGARRWAGGGHSAGAVCLQIQYLNAYYETIRARVGPELQRQQLEEEYQWLQRSTEPFAQSSAASTAASVLAITSLISVLLAELQA